MSRPILKTSTFLFHAELAPTGKQFDEGEEWPEGWLDRPPGSPGAVDGPAPAKHVDKGVGPGKRLPWDTILFHAVHARDGALFKAGTPRPSRQWAETPALFKHKANGEAKMPVYDEDTPAPDEGDPSEPGDLMDDLLQVTVEPAAAPPPEVPAPPAPPAAPAPENDELIRQLIGDHQPKPEPPATEEELEVLDHGPDLQIKPGEGDGVEIPEDWEGLSFAHRSALARRILEIGSPPKGFNSEKVNGVIQQALAARAAG